VFLLSLSAQAPPSSDRRALWRSLAALPPPGVPGLLARHWQPERRHFTGRYLFADGAAARAFALQPGMADPAAALVCEPRLASLIQLEPGLLETQISRPVFILSSPRAGSTLLYDLLARLPGLWTVDGESHGVIEGTRGLHPAQRGFQSHRLTAADLTPAVRQACLAGFLADLRDHQGTRYLDLPAALRPQAARLLEKTPENALRLPFLNALCPDARFIVLHRDARQSVSSLVEAWGHGGFTNIPDLPGWNRKAWCFLLPGGWEALNHRSLSDVAAFQWQAANRQILDDLECLAPERWTVVDHDDLVTAPRAVFQRLCRFLDLEESADLAGTIPVPLPLSATTISPPSPIKWRSHRAFQPSSVDHLGPLQGRLRNLTDRHAPAPPIHSPLQAAGTVRFSCFLDNPPPAPAGTADPPEWGADPPELPANDWIIHPTLHLQLGSTVPLPLLRRSRFRERFLPNHPLLWIEDPTTGALLPYWMRRHQAPLLAQCQPGRPAPATLSPPLLHQLRAAEVLLSRAELERTHGARRQSLEQASRALRSERFCTFRGLLPPAQRLALARYYQALMDAGHCPLGDAQVERRHGWHNEWMARFFHHQFTEFIGRLVGEPVKPTYAYSSAYRAGAALRAHLDRRQCEITVSLLIDQPAVAEPWPLWFLTASGPSAVQLSLGDAVVFHGCELPHWREQAPHGQWTTMLLFHYVPCSFRGVLA
jgi:hypothetical protein